MRTKQNPDRDNTGAERASIQPKQSQKRKSPKLAGHTKSDRKNSGPPPDFAKWFLGLQERMAETLYHLDKAHDLYPVTFKFALDLRSYGKKLEALETQLRLMPAGINRKCGLWVADEGQATLEQLVKFVFALAEWEACRRAWHWST
jgi:hypothetical protein